jgi:nucleotide-binding universal stress UspA family protein
MHVCSQETWKDKTPGQKNSYSAEQMMLQWKNTIEEANPHISVCCSILHHHSIQQSIIEVAIKVRANLIVIGKKSNHSWFPFLHTVLTTKLAEATSSAVLTVKPGSLHNKIRTVVVPVTNYVPERKMQAISALCAKRGMKVYLVTFCNNDHIPAKFSASALLKVYQWLKLSLHCSAEYAVLHGTNKAKAIIEYAEKIDADILLVNPGEETKFGWLNSHISDIFPSRSKMQVLTVQPQIHS